MYSMGKESFATHDVIQFIRQHRLCALSTVSSEGQPRAASVFLAVDDQLDLFFMTKVETIKYRHILQNPRVAVVITDEVGFQTVQAEGVAEEVQRNETKHWMIEQLSHNASSSTGQLPIDQIAGNAYVFLRIRPTWLRWGQFQGQGGKDMFQQIIPPAGEK